MESDAGFAQKKSRRLAAGGEFLAKGEAGV